MKFITAIASIALFALFSFKIIDNTQKVKDYFSVPGPLQYNKTMYQLSWSDHPNDNYYKQEYIPATEKAATFSKMITIETVVGDVVLADVVKSKIAELQQRKKSDPVTNYQVIENKQTGEYLLDFVLSQASNKQDIVEWNAYRYMKLKEKSGRKGIMLVSLSKRSYGDGSTAFLKALKTERVTDINNFVTYNVPTIQIVR